MPETIDIIDIIRIGHPFIVFKTWEADRAIADTQKRFAERLQKVAQNGVKPLFYTWDINDGITAICPESIKIGYPTKPPNPFNKDAPPEAEKFGRIADLSAMADWLFELVTDDKSRITIVFFKLDCFSKVQELWWDNPDAVAAIIRNTEKIKRSGPWIFVHPTCNIPVVMQHKALLAEFKLPDMDERKEIIKSTVKNIKSQTTQEIEVDLDLMAEKLGGMGYVEAVNTLRLAARPKEKKFSLDVIVQRKAEVIKGIPGLTLYEGIENFDNLGGCRGVINFFKRIWTPDNLKNPRLRPRALSFIGVTGGGKTHCAKAIAASCQMPLLQYDVASAQSKWVGESAHNFDRIIEVAEANAPCELFIDEFDKFFTGEQEHEVTSQLKGKFLTWLNDKKTNVFVIITANNVRAFATKSPEFFRSGRFDRLFFFDLPNAVERKAIWEIYKKYFELDDDGDLEVEAEGWVGSDIRECCKTAAQWKVPLVEAAESIIPVGKSSAEQIMSVRQWANGRCISASTGERYVYSERQSA